MDGEQLTLEQAIGLLSLPRDIGHHPETGEMIQVGIGRFGPYVRMGAVYGSLDRDDDVLSIGINRAVDLIARKMASVRTLGAHPTDQELVAVRKGRFGPYVQHGKMVANLPRGVMMDDVSLDQALALLAEKGKQLRPRGAARRGRGAAAAKSEPSTAPASEASAAEAPARAPRKKAKTAAAKRRAAPPKRAASKTAAKTPPKKKAAARARKPAARRR
jgi:DNA topoisomerase I